MFEFKATVRSVAQDLVLVGGLAQEPGMDASCIKLLAILTILAIPWTVPCNEVSIYSNQIGHGLVSNSGSNSGANEFRGAPLPKATCQMRPPYFTPVVCSWYASTYL